MSTAENGRSPQGRERALSGITVLDLGQAFMGPYCGLLLQRLGAEVIKVEPPQGEPYRRPTARKGVEAVQFGLFNAGKRSLCIDLKQDRGRELFIRLAQSADVVLQNYAPETFDRLIGIERLLEANPRLIVASGSGYGSTGPYASLRAMDLTIQAMSGVMATTGFPDGPPVRTGPAVVDITGGAHLTAAILAALVQREHTGRGQHVEVALYDAIFPSMASNIGGFFDSDGDIPERTGNRHGGLAVAPYNAYPTRDGWVAILCLHDRHWQSLCGAMSRPELTSDPRFESNSSRSHSQDELDAIVGHWTREHMTAQVVGALTPFSVPCAPVMSLEQVIKDPHVAEHELLVRRENEDREWWTMSSSLRLGASPQPDDNVPAKLGEHNYELLSKRLGLSDRDISELERDQVVVCKSEVRSEK
jgi:crotonobetainyl-CoA:carnitine CoA-transferase CaiB-like acyl-CoA transferase